MQRNAKDAERLAWKIHLAYFLSADGDSSSEMRSESKCSHVRRKQLVDTKIVRHELLEFYSCSVKLRRTVFR